MCIKIFKENALHLSIGVMSCFSLIMQGHILLELCRKNIQFRLVCFTRSTIITQPCIKWFPCYECRREDNLPHEAKWAHLCLVCKMKGTPEREWERKKHGYPNPSILNKRRSRARRICDSGGCKFFEVSVPAKYKDVTSKERKNTKNALQRRHYFCWQKRNKVKTSFLLAFTGICFNQLVEQKTKKKTKKTKLWITKIFSRRTGENCGKLVELKTNWILLERIQLVT